MSVARRSLWPREHGAYAQLAAPLATALVLRAPGLPSILLAIAACCAFLANEPLLVVLGHRGPRLRERSGARARRRLAALGIAGAGAAAVGIALAPAAAIAIAGASALPAAGLIALAWTRAERSIGGELLAAVALPGAAAPVAVASGLPWRQAAVLWGAWAIGYACTVAAVHRVIARHRRPAAAIASPGGAGARSHARRCGEPIDHALAVATAGVAIAGGALAMTAAMAAAAVPLAGAAAVLLIAPPRATHLRAIGVGLVIASLASGALAIAAA